LHDRGYTLPTYRSWIVRENKWRAARHGVDADLIVNESGGLMPLTQALDDLVAELAPVAARLGCADELAYLRKMAERPSYKRQRQVVADGGSLVVVVDSLVLELA